MHFLCSSSSMPSARLAVLSHHRAAPHPSLQQEKQGCPKLWNSLVWSLTFGASEGQDGQEDSEVRGCVSVKRAEQCPAQPSPGLGQ